MDSRGMYSTIHETHTYIHTEVEKQNQAEKDHELSARL